MNPNSRQVYTCISSADKVCISHRVSILSFFRNGELKVGGTWVEGGREGGGAGYASGWGFIKILPEAKSSSQLSFFFPPKN